MKPKELSQLWLSQIGVSKSQIEGITEEKMGDIVDRIVHGRSILGSIEKLQCLPYLFADDIDTLKSDDNLRKRYLIVAEHLLNDYKELEDKSYNDLLEFIDGKVVGIGQEIACLFEKVWRRRGRKEICLLMTPREKKIWSLINNPSLRDEATFWNLSNSSSGIPIGWWFYIGAEYQFELVIPAGAITGISAPTGHGKTRMAENIIHAVLKRWVNIYEGKRVLYIHYEESDIDVVQHLANIHLNNKSHNNGLDYIRNYVLSGDYYLNNPSNDLDRALDWAFAAWESGRLELAANCGTIEEIRAIIRSGIEKANLSLVVIDGIQGINTRVPGYTERKAVMEYVCCELNRIAVSTGLPIVVTSQVNGQYNNLSELSTNKNSDTTGLEQMFDMNLLLWYPAFDAPIPSVPVGIYTMPSAETTFYYPPEIIDDVITKLKKAGYKMGSRNQLVCKLGKNRGGQANVWSILDFNPNTGRMSSENPKSFFKK